MVLRLRKEHFKIVLCSDLRSVSDAQACWSHKQAAAEELAARICKGIENTSSYVIGHTESRASRNVRCLSSNSTIIIFRLSAESLPSATRELLYCNFVDLRSHFLLHLLNLCLRIFRTFIGEIEYKSSSQQMRVF